MGIANADRLDSEYPSGRFKERLVTDEALLRSITTVSHVTTTANTTAIVSPSHSRTPGTPVLRAVAPGAASLTRSVVTHCSSRLRSPADCHRSSGSLARHRLMTRSSERGVIGWRVDGARGSSLRIAPIRLAWPLP